VVGDVQRLARRRVPAACRRRAFRKLHRAADDLSSPPPPPSLRLRLSSETSPNDERHLHAPAGDSI